ncbi:MAG: NADH-quinone oxidoreductase subunit NuoE [Oscillospiraceae bacterium]|jgi:NADH-quinone oxidoreductase subunit E|nr:NADH-quinone oxidoreductase subunit NuoE [Oscillospiraceae bacterium]
MNCNCAEKLKQKLEPFLKNYTEGSLIPILQKAQEVYGWLPDDVLEHIARKTGVKPAKIIGVVSFYTQFRTKPVGKNLILLCQGTACHVNGSAEIERVIRDILKTEEGGITEDGKFTYNNVACLGCCSLAPAMMIGARTFGKLTRESVVEILNEY